MDVERVVVKIIADAADYDRVLNLVETRMAGLAQRASTMAAGGGLLGAIVGVGIGTGLVGAMAAIQAPINVIGSGLSAIAGLTKEAAVGAIELGVNYEKSALAFEVMTGSAENARKLLADIRQLGVTSPYNSKDLREQTQVLLGMGVASDQVVTVLSRLGDIAGGDKDKLDRLALAFGQVVAAGKFMGTELRQFTEAGVGAGDFAKASGMTGFQLRNLMEQGKADLNIMIRGINALTSTGGRFAGLGNRASQETVGGQYSNLVERFEILGEDLSTAMFKRFNVAGLLDKLQHQFSGVDVGRITGWMGAAGDAAEVFGTKAVKWFGEAWVALKPVVAGVGAVGVNLKDQLGVLFGDADWKKTQKLMLEFSKDFVVGFAQMTKVTLELALALGMVGAELYGMKDSLLVKLMAPGVQIGKWGLQGMEAVFPGSTTGTAKGGTETSRELGAMLNNLKKFDAGGEVGKTFDKLLAGINDAEKQGKGAIFGPGNMPLGMGLRPEENPFLAEVKKAQGVYDLQKAQKPVGVGWDATMGQYGESMQGARDEQQRKLMEAQQRLIGLQGKAADWEAIRVDGVKKYADSLNKAGGKIDEIPGLSSGALEIVKSMQKAGEAGLDPYSKFLTTTKNINEAYYGKEGVPGQLTPKLYQHGITAAFDELTKSVNKLENTEARMPELALQSSQKSRDIINTQTVKGLADPLQRIEEVLKEAKDLQEATADYERRTADGVEAILKKPAPQSGGVK